MERNEARIIKENEKFKLKEVIVTEDLVEKYCEVCSKECKSVIYWLEGEYNNLDAFMCEECLSKLKEVLGS